MAIKILSEELYNSQFDYPETSSLINRINTRNGNSIGSLDIMIASNWYRNINAFLWLYHSFPILEVTEVLARISASSHSRTAHKWLDTVIGFQSGNWIYEFLSQSTKWSTKAESLLKSTLAKTQKLAIHKNYLIASQFSSIASYPHFRHDKLATYAQNCAYHLFNKAMEFSPYTVKKIAFICHNKTINARLYSPQTKKNCPVVLLCGGLGNLQIDYYHYFSEYLAPQGIAMLSLDFPSVGDSCTFKLTQNSSELYHAALEQLTTLPWIDSQNIIVVGIRFGTQIATKLAYQCPDKIKGLCNIWPIFHQIFVDKNLQLNLPIIYKDMLASRLGKTEISDKLLDSELSDFSLINQGLFTKPCPFPVINILFENDKTSTKQEANLITSSEKNTIQVFPDKPLQKNLHNSLQASVTWMKSIL